MKVEERRGKHIAAFFDLDGTLIPKPSLEKRLFSVLRRSGAIPYGNYIRWMVQMVQMLPGGINGLLQNNKRYLRGVSCERALEQMETIPFYGEALARLAWHARQGHRIVLVSGTLEPLGRLAATALERNLEARGEAAACLVYATKLEVKARRWTGCIVGEAMHGEAKARAIRRIAGEQNLDLSRSFAYGDSLEDRYMLSIVGSGQAVNPGRELTKLAKLHDWRIWHWSLGRKVPSERERFPEERIQQVAGGV